ncbi:MULTISPECIES: NADH-quinone oxidoreductase subunit N [unclassified Haladaptatus]|uniref:NADH-quinone oxidoreductase subunit N n=1 Tax=unclassified Haladaptatus TaxID=2622732 RepID=UPI002FCE1095
MAVSTALALSPVVILGVAATLLFLFDSLTPDKADDGRLAGIATAGALLSLAGTGYLFTATDIVTQPLSLYGDQLVIDGMSLFFGFIFTSVAAMVSLASYDYLRGHKNQAEYYILVLLAAMGMSLMASANSLATAFVALELASLPSYALVSFLKKNRGSVEAGLKYFLIGALSSAVFAYGISLVYAATGALQFGAIAEAAANTEFVGILGLGVLMVLGGFAFKTASVPFHFWAPEAYEGAPAPISGFLSSASKAAGFVVAFRVFVEAFPLETVPVDWVLAFQILAIVTMTLGNFAAAVQENVKRMLAYSSIGHAGYVLIGLAALTSGGQNDLVLGASMMHLLVYGFMNTGAFLFIAMTEHWGIGRKFEDFNGLGKQAPLACAAMTVFLFSLAGLPIGAGFLSKYVLFAAAVGAGFWWLAAFGAINSALSLYYYSRVVKAMWIEEATEDRELSGYPAGLYAAVVGAAIITIVLLPAFNPVASTAVDAASVLFG